VFIGISLREGAYLRKTQRIPFGLRHLPKRFETRESRVIFEIEGYWIQIGCENMSWPEIKADLERKIDTMLQLQAKQLDAILLLREKIEEVLKKGEENGKPRPPCG
jgi:hypothetical protein